MYNLNDGTEVTKDQIQSALDAGKARIVHNRGDHSTSSALMIDGRDIDTRGQCHSVWEEVWTREPKDLAEALRAAQGWG